MKRHANLQPVAGKQACCRQQSEVVWINPLADDFIAKTTKLPLAVVRLDYKKKELKFEGFIKLTGDLEVDYAYLRKMYEGVEGFNVQQAAPIRPLPSQESIK